MAPRGSGGRTGAVHATRALSVTTRSRVQAGLNATVTTPPQGPSTPTQNAGATNHEPLPNYPGPAQPNPGDNPPHGSAPNHPRSPRMVPIPPTPRAPSISPIPPAASEQDSVMLTAIHEIANSQAELSQSIARTQQEMTELRSVIDGVRSSRASSRQSSRSMREAAGGKRSGVKLAVLSGDETPGLRTVSESSSDQDDLYASASRSGNRADARVELGQGVATGMGTNIDPPVAEQPLKRPDSSGSDGGSRTDGQGLVTHTVQRFFPHDPWAIHRDKNPMTHGLYNAVQRCTTP